MLGEGVGISVTSTMPKHAVPLAVDRHRIREMLLNPGHQRDKRRRRAARWISSWRIGGAVTLTVRDTLGIAPGDSPHIFERFWRADPARSRTGERPGTGLGLAITKWIAEAHGGSITVQEPAGAGNGVRRAVPAARGAASGDRAGHERVIRLARGARVV